MRNINCKNRLKKFVLKAVIIFSIIYICFNENLGKAVNAVNKEDIVLLKSGKSPYQIVFEPDASPSEVQAGKELQFYFKACTGVELPISIYQPSKSNVDTPMIILGFGKATEKLGIKKDGSTLGEQGFIIHTSPPHLIIAGTREAGTLYGVYYFLEKYLGVRRYAPGVTKTPSIVDLTIPSIKEFVKPAFLWRHTSYTLPGEDESFRSWLRDNSGSGNENHPYGIQHQHDGRCHSYFSFISPAEFFNIHPEYFSEIGGIRIGEETQLCLTNPDVLKIVTERMLKRMAQMPNARQHNFSQMDYYNYCQCSRCREINKKYGTPGGTQFWFLNRLAEETSKVYPNKLIGTLAYMYTEEPPKGLKLHPNIAVWLCHMFPSCDSHPIESCPLNANYKRRAIEWSKITSHLYIWHYIVNFAHYYNPFPNFRAMAEDMKFYKKIGVEGVYLQGMYAPGGGGEFSSLRAYYGMKLLWDPNQNSEAIIKDFLEGYYGHAWQPIWEYINLLHDEVEKKNIHMHLYTNPAQGYLSDEILKQANSLFDKAEKLVSDNSDLIERVKVARMPLLYAKLFPRNGYKIEGNKLVWQSPKGSMNDLMELINRMKKHGFQSVREVAGEPETLIMFYSVLSQNHKIEVLSNKFLRVEIVPILAGRVLRIIDRETGKCITAYNTKQNLYYPFAGGVEDRVGEIASFYGWIEPANVESSTDTSLTTFAKTVNGFLLKRTIRLDADRPVLYIESTLTNDGNSPKSARLRNHLELDLGDLAKTKIKFTNLDGVEINEDIREIIAGLREGKHYYGEKTPRDAWSFYGSKGLKVTQHFNNEDVDFTWIYAYPETLGELEVEIWAKRKVLNPGESVTLKQSLTIEPIR